MRREKKSTLLFLFVVVTVIILSVVLFRVYVVHVSRTLSNFSALWNTTDALLHYVQKNREWPSDWESLSESLEHVDPQYSSGNYSFLKERVEVNFNVDIDQLDRSSRSYVRLKNNCMPPEQERANRRIHRTLIELDSHDCREGPLGQNSRVTVLPV